MITLGSELNIPFLVNTFITQPLAFFENLE